MVGHIPLEDGIGVRVPGRQHEGAPRTEVLPTGRAECARPSGTRKP
jgi:hypothetical protein